MQNVRDTERDCRFSLDQIRREPITLAYIHRDCMPALADFLEVEIPEYTHRYRKLYAEEGVG